MNCILEYYYYYLDHADWTFSECRLPTCDGVSSTFNSKIMPNNDYYNNVLHGDRRAGECRRARQTGCTNLASVRNSMSAHARTHNRKVIEKTRRPFREPYKIRCSSKSRNLLITRILCLFIVFFYTYTICTAYRLCCLYIPICINDNNYYCIVITVFK